MTVALKQKRHRSQNASPSYRTDPLYGITLLLEVVTSILLHTVSCLGVIPEEAKPISFVSTVAFQPYNAAWVVNTASPAKFSHLSLCAGMRPDTDIV